MLELSAVKKLANVKSGLESDASAENFRTLAEEYSSNSSVDLEEASYAYINGNISKEALMWVLEERKAGDYEVFETESGTYILYFVEQGETYRNLSVNSKLVSEWVEQLTKTTVENCKFDLEAALNGSVELKFNQQQS